MSRKNKLHFTPPRTTPMENASEETINKICNQLINHGRSKGVDEQQGYYNSFKLIELKNHASGTFLEYFPKFIEESCDLLCDRMIFEKILEGVRALRVCYRLVVGIAESFTFRRTIIDEESIFVDNEPTKMDISLGNLYLIVNISNTLILKLEFIHDDNDYFFDGIVYI